MNPDDMAVIIRQIVLGLRLAVEGNWRP